MFRIECFVDEKNMGEVLKRLNGIARNLTHNYVPNVEPKRNGKIKAVAGNRIELIQRELHKRKLTQITGPEMKELVEEIGLNRTSYSHFIQEMVKAGMLKKGGKGPGHNTMIYNVTGK